jgi:hypothetical protein
VSSDNNLATDLEHKYTIIMIDLSNLKKIGEKLTWNEHVALGAQFGKSGQHINYLLLGRYKEFKEEHYLIIEAALEMIKAKEARQEKLNKKIEAL